jgi:hypothetical protein
LDRLLEVASKHAVPIETQPACRFPPRAGESVYGVPVDPLLAAAFSRFGKLVLGRLGLDTWLMLPGDDEKSGLLLESEEWQGYFPHMFWPDHFRALMPFGSHLLYRYATVPEFANAEGLQPVVFLDPYEEIHAIPIASSVDRFFDTFSRYVELMVEEPDYQAGSAPMVSFPRGVPELVASDKPLMEMITEGRFDRLMYERNKTGWRDEVSIERTREWISRPVH